MEGVANAALDLRITEAVQLFSKKSNSEQKRPFLGRNSLHMQLKYPRLVTWFN